MKKQLHRRLESYWRMELFCAALLPTTGLLFFAAFGQAIGPFSILAMLVMSFLLFIGGSYWRAKSLQLGGDANAIDAMLSWGSRTQVPVLFGVIAIGVLCLLELFFFKISLSTLDRIVGLIATTRANLEYINYFHHQLQHFDHMPDFHRLVGGQGFRRSKMNLDLRRYRAKH